MNIRELTVGDYVYVSAPQYNGVVGQVIEVLRDGRVSVIIVSQTHEDGQYVTGSVYTKPLSELSGIVICLACVLREFGFTDSDEKGWILAYWFGTDMKLLYRHDWRKNTASFRFKTDYRKSYVSISCQYVHELQNIMRFLTGGELEFEYKKIYPL